MVHLTFFLPPVPTSNLYAQLNGLQLCVDPASLLWINLFSRGLLHTLDQVKAFYHLQDSNKVEEHVDIRVDGAQLKVNTDEHTVLFKAFSFTHLVLFSRKISVCNCFSLF